MRKLARLTRKAYGILAYRLQHHGLRVTLLWVFARGIPKLTGIPLVRYSRITPQLYVGGQFGKRGKRKLERLGVTGDVNLRTEFDDAAHGLALEHYCHLPTIDDDAPTPDHLQQGADFIQRVIDGDGIVYVHCAGGIGRAPTMAAAYFITQGKTLEDAVALIKQTRPFIRIMPPQWAQLQQFEAMHQRAE